MGQTIVAALIIVQAFLLLIAVANDEESHRSTSKRPNIVFILSDDQDIELGGFGPHVMRKTHEKILSQGAAATQAFVATSVCCPSRSEYLSGRYAHNLRDTTYEPIPAIGGCGDEPVEEPHRCGCMRMNCTMEFESSTYADHLQNAGYKTAYFGKYLNPPAMVKFCAGTTKYNSTRRGLPGKWPSGWDEFFGMCDQASGPSGGYYDVNWVDSVHDSITYTGKMPEEYTSSIIGNKTVEFIRRASENPSNPFLVVAATRGPHAPQIPAPWYTDTVMPAAPRLPSYNTTPSGIAPWMHLNKPLSIEDAKGLDKVHADRLRACLSVDDIVGAVVDELDAVGVLDNTYIFVSSDHGYHLGEFRLATGKEHFYTFDTHIPLAIRGPGIPAQSSIDAPVGNVDIGPTFLDIAGLSPTDAGMDGRSLLPLLTKNDTEGWRDAFLSELYSFNSWPASFDDRMNSNPNNTWRSLRIINTTANLLYAETTVADDYNFDHPYWYEMYNIETDDGQLNNIYSSLDAAVKVDLAHQIEAAWQCKGDTCK